MFTSDRARTRDLMGITWVAASVKPYHWSDNGAIDVRMRPSEVRRDGTLNSARVEDRSANFQWAPQIFSGLAVK